MKKLYFVFAAACMFSACNDQKKTEAGSGETKMTKTEVVLPYTANYSSSFEIGNPEYSKTILQGSWKDWETNSLDNMKNWIADSIVAYHSDNNTVNGLDSLTARWKRGRAEYSSVLDTIDAVIPVYSTDRKENWVLVWAREIDVKADGSRDTTALMETWRINKEGKADMLYQFERKRKK